MDLHPDVIRLLAQMSEGNASLADSVPIVQARQRRNEFLQASGPQEEPVAERQDICVRTAAADVHCRLFRPHNAQPGIIVYLHGGGWVFGDLPGTDGLCSALANRTGYAVLNVDYRLAPECPYPAALDDVMAAAEWASSIAGGGPVVLGGDSAGGNLAAAAALRARDAGGPRVSLQVLLFAPLDHRLETVSSRKFGDGYFLRTADLRWFWNQYIPDVRDRDHPYVSPARAADLTGLPPALITVAGFDPLRDEGLAYAVQLREAGVQAAVRNYEDMVHGFISIPRLIPAADTALTDLAQDIRSLLAGQAAMEATTSGQERGADLAQSSNQPEARPAR